LKMSAIPVNGLFPLLQLRSKALHSPLLNTTITCSQNTQNQSWQNFDTVIQQVSVSFKTELILSDEESGSIVGWGQ
jgi:hypothetical protein